MSATVPTPALARYAKLAPWTDKKGRLHPLRSVVFTLLLLPGLWLAWRWSVWGLGARPLNVALHSTGYWAVWLLVASLVVSPLKALLADPNVVVVRRMVGVAAMAYGLIHIVLYMADQNWRPLVIVTEIAVRFYLTIGFVALLGLLVLGVTSTETMVRRLGPRWKPLHRWVYAIAILAGAHYFLQSKADVSQALLAAGVFFWLMGWRMLPAGRDRTALPLLGLAIMAGLLTLLTEFLWYRFGTRVDPWKVMRAEAAFDFGLRPAALVLALGLIAAGLVALRRLSLTAWGETLGFTVLVYAAGAFAGDVAGFLFGLMPDDPAEDGWAWKTSLLAAIAFALAGVARFWIRGQPERRALDLLWALACAYPLLLNAEDRRLAIGGAGLLAVAAVLLTARMWPVSRRAALLVLPVAGLLAVEASGLL